jgi:hypothetical protein
MLGTRAHPENATKVAGDLEGQPPVEPVSCPRCGGAAEQMPLPGGIPSSPVEGGRGRALAVAANAVGVSTRAASLRETHGYVGHRASGKGTQMAGPEDPLWLLVGLGHPDYPIEDLMRAAER